MGVSVQDALSVWTNAHWYNDIFPYRLTQALKKTMERKLKQVFHMFPFSCPVSFVYCRFGLKLDGLIYCLKNMGKVKETLDIN